MAPPSSEAVLFSNLDFYIFMVLLLNISRAPVLEKAVFYMKVLDINTKLTDSSIIMAPA